MEASKQMPERLQEALRHGVLKRLPLTFLPFVNQQLHEWEFLFANERRSTDRLVYYVESLSAEESAALFSDLIRLEDKMGVRGWQQFSTEEETIENSSELARSPYFQQWREAVQRVFDAADRYAVQSGGAGAKAANRAIVLDIPALLPVQPQQAWEHWHGAGRRVKLQPLPSISAPSAWQGALVGLIGDAARRGGSPDSHDAPDEEAAAESWAIDGASSLVDACLVDKRSAATSHAVLLSHARLASYRTNFLREMNSMSKNLANADSVYDHLRKVDVSPWCPKEVAADAAVREFVRALYLSGNGAVIFGNSFVEWAASEALRRARPRFLAARFSVRSKPKPFTAVAVFENPDRINPLPAVDDNPGSAVDAEILAAYIWLSAVRYEEYRQATVCVCVAESAAEAYLVAPPEFAWPEASEPAPVETLIDSLRRWIC